VKNLFKLNLNEEKRLPGKRKQDNRKKLNLKSIFKRLWEGTCTLNRNCFFFSTKEIQIDAGTAILKKFQPKFQWNPGGNLKRKLVEKHWNSSS
jgi:hypothetical protein